MEILNPYITKKTVTVTEQIEVEKEIDVIDWDLVPVGTYMTGKIEGNSVEGVLSKENGTLYFCQNLKDGDRAEFKFGFLYSWSFNPKSDGTLTDNVSNIQFPPKPDDLVLPPIPPKPFELKVGTYKAKIHVNHIEVGCQTITKENILEVLAKMDELSKLFEETK